MSGSRRVVSRIVASVILAFGIGAFWALAYLLITLGCTFEGTCSTRESVPVIGLGVACLALLGFALWRIWRR